MIQEANKHTERPSEPWHALNPLIIWQIFYENIDNLFVIMVGNLLININGIEEGVYTRSDAEKRVCRICSHTLFNKLLINVTPNE